MALSTDFRLRIYYTDAAESRMDQVFEASGSELNPELKAYNEAFDPRLLPIVPKTTDGIYEDDKLLIMGYFDSTGTIDVSDTRILLPVSVKNIKTGVVSERTLKTADLLGTSDITISSASTWTRLGAYTVSAQEGLKIGRRIAENSRMQVSLDYD